MFAKATMKYALVSGGRVIVPQGYSFMVDLRTCKERSYVSGGQNKTYRVIHVVGVGDLPMVLLDVQVTELPEPDMSTTVQRLPQWISQKTDLVLKK